MKGFGTLMKGIPKSSLALFLSCEDTVKSLNLEEGSH